MNYEAPEVAQRDRALPLVNGAGVATFSLLIVEALWRMGSVIALGRVQATSASPIDLVYVYAVTLCGDIMLRACSEIASARWIARSTVDYLDAVKSAFRGRTDLLGSKHAAQRFIASSVSPGPALLDGSLAYLVQTIRVIGNTTGIALGLSSTLGPASMGVLALTAALVILLGRFAIPLTHARMSFRNISYARAAGLWELGFDNLVVGNGAQFNAWEQRAKRSVARYLRHSVGQVRVGSLLQAATGLVAYGPILLVAVWSDAPPALFLSILPKMLEAGKGLMDCGNLLASYGNFSSGIRQLQENVTPISPSKLEERIRWDGLRISGAATVSCLDDVVLEGRVTIRGPNGVGKSSLIALLKLRAGDRAALLPAYSQMLSRVAAGAGSSGEEKYRLLLSVINDPSNEVLLLDEWDANLDPQRVLAVSRELDDFVRRGGAVIEVRHREDVSVDALAFH